MFTLKMQWKMEDDGLWPYNADKNGSIHNHNPPPEWKIGPNVLRDITQAAQRNIRVTPKEVQNGVGMDYQPIEKSLPAANNC